MGTHRTAHKVRFHELDPYDHVNHAIYVTYFEIGRVDALEHLGMGLDSLKELGFQFVVTKLDVKFRAAATAGDELIIETAVAQFLRASTVWKQRIVRELRDGESENSDRIVVASAEVTVAVTNSLGKPVRPAPFIFDALRPIEAG